MIFTKEFSVNRADSKWLEKQQETKLSRAKINMPTSARSGIALLIIGAIVVGVGTYTNRGALSIYGLILVIGGFSLYMISSLYVKRNSRK